MTMAKHNLMAIRETTEGIQIESNIGYTKSDCAKWMRANQIAETVQFARPVVKLTGEPITGFKVKEVSSAVPKERKQRARRARGQVEGSPTLPLDGSSEGGDQGQAGV